MVRVLSDMDLNGLSQPLVNKAMGLGSGPIEAALSTARKLEQWEIMPPSAHTSNPGTIFEVFRKINSANDHRSITEAIDNGFAKTMRQICGEPGSGSSVQSALSSLAILTEAEEVFSAQGVEHLKDTVARFKCRDESLQMQRCAPIARKPPRR